MSSFNIFSITWIAIAVVIFFSLFFVVAPYGRHIKNGWGPNISARLGWVFMESSWAFENIEKQIVLFCFEYLRALAGASGVPGSLSGVLGDFLRVP